MVTPSSRALRGNGKSALVGRRFEVSERQITLTLYHHVFSRLTAFIRFTATASALADTSAQRREIGSIGRSRHRRFRTGQEDISQVQPIPVVADQFPHIFAAGAVAALIDLLVDKGLERIRQGDVYRAHGARLEYLEKFGQRQHSPSASRQTTTSRTKAQRAGELMEENRNAQNEISDS